MTVVPAAASLCERRGASWLEPAPDAEEDMDALWLEWAERATCGDEAELRALLADRGIEPDEARASLRRVRLVPGAELPVWASALRELLLASLHAPAPEDVALAASLTANGSLTVTAEASIPIAKGFGAHALAGFVAPVRSWVEPGPGVPACLPAELVAHLLARMLLVCLPVFRAGALEAFQPGPAPFEGWVATLRSAPALGRALGVAALNGRSFAHELLARLQADRDELEPLLAATPRVVRRRSTVDTGDSHDDGRFVLSVPFEGGRRLLYKPKDLRVGGVLGRLTDALGADLQLPARLGRDGHVWEAFVEARLPESLSEWGDLAHEVGMWTCLFDLLGTTDMIVSNVLVSGSGLVPVDTETLLAFHFSPTDELPWLPAGTSSRLLSAPMLSRNQTLLGDVGLLAESANWPLLDHLDRTLAGYAEMQCRLTRAHESLRELLDELADAPVRAVVRSTWVYLILLMQSLAPDALRSGVTRDLVLERLWRAQRLGLAITIVEAEVASLRDLDVPLFRFLPGGRNVIGPGGRVATDVLSEAPLERVRARIDALRPEPDPAELDAIAAQFFCGAANARQPAPPTVPGRPATTRADPEGQAVDWSVEVVRAGDELLELLAHGAPGSARLEGGIVYDGNNHLFVFSPRLSADLLSGSLGIAVALADVASASGEERFAAEATRQRDRAAATLHAFADDVERWSRTRTDPPLGGLHWGVSAALYTLLRLPSAADEETLARAGSTLAGFAAGDAYAVGRWLRGTMPSALLVTASLEPATPGARGLAAAVESFREELCALLVEQWDLLWPDRSPRPALAALFPSRHALAALALHRHARSVGRPTPEPAAAWAASFLHANAAEADRLIAIELGAALAPREPAVPATSLGCLDLIEEQLLLWQAAPTSASLELAGAAGARILANRRESGRWFPEGVAPDRFRLSALWGLAAVVRAFAGLAAPERWSSLRLLQQPPAASQLYASGSQPGS